MTAIYFRRFFLALAFFLFIFSANSFAQQSPSETEKFLFDAVIGWMNSAPHRENILNPKLNAIGIAVEMRGTQYFAVQDFSTAVSSLSREEQEKKVGQLLLARGLRLDGSSDDARKACDSSARFFGARPLAILHFEAPDLNRLPEQLIRTIKNGSYRKAAVGSCHADESAGFSRFRIAVLLY